MKRSYHRAKPKTAKVQSLDLGLAGIINGRRAVAETVGQNEASAVPVPLTSITTDSGSLEYVQLAEKKAWAELARLCESQLPPGAPPEDMLRLIEPRLWWIRSQLMLGVVPKSILAAPLDAASRLLMEACLKGQREDLQRLKPVAAGLLAEMSAALQRNGDISLALSFLERAYRLDSSYQSSLKEFVHAALEAEKSGSQPEGILLRDQLERLKVELEGCQSSLVQSTGRKIDCLAVPSLETGRWYRMRLYVGALAVVVALAFLVLIWREGAELFSSNDPRSWSALWNRPAEPSFAMLGSSRLASPLGLEVERTTRISRLDTLFYDLQRPRPTPKGNTPTSVREAPPRPSAKEKVNTSSPVEAPDMAAKDSPAHGRLSDNRVAEAGEEPLALAGRVASAPSFEDFKRPKLYAVLVATRVMSEPSLRAEALAELKPGDEIMVEGRHGYWLVIRSKQGKTAYILAQDAVPAREW